MSSMWNIGHWIIALSIPLGVLAILAMFVYGVTKASIYLLSLA